MSPTEPEPEAWCSLASARSDEPMPGTAPHADVWVVVEQQHGWGAAELTRSEHGVRVVMARPLHGRHHRARAWIAWAGAAAPTLRRGELADPGQVADWDLREVRRGAFDDWGTPVSDPLLLLCTNGRRDRCCGHIGGRVAQQLEGTPEADHILRSTHLGGHRFAPTALLLPWGALHGRLSSESVLSLLAQARAGRGVTPSLRGYSPLSSPAQVAEVHARRLTGHVGLTACAVTVEVAGDRARAEVEVPGSGTVLVLLRQVVSDVLPSCGKHPEPTTRWVVVPDSSPSAN